MTVDQKLKALELLAKFTDLEIAAQNGTALPLAQSDVGWLSQTCAVLRGLLGIG